MPAITPTDARPQMTIRVGVSGHRSFADPAAPERIQKTIKRILADLRAALTATHALARSAIPRPVKNSPTDEERRLIQAAENLKAAAQIYSDQQPPRLAVLSPLAEGADRLVAEAALAQGAWLSAVLPMPEAEYERDFPGSVAQFRTLRAAAESMGGVTRLHLKPGFTPDERTETYAQVGAFTLRNCDILIAIWDGQPPRGPGGTAEVVARARAAGLPVLHIHPHTDRLTILRSRGRQSAYSPRHIRAIVRAVTGVRPSTPRHQSHEALGLLRSPRVKASVKARDFLFEGPYEKAPGAAAHLASRLYPNFIRSFRDREFKAARKPSFPAEDNKTAQFLFDYFQRTDALATYYSDLHRSVFMAVYVLGGFAIVAAFTAVLLKMATYYYCAKSATSSPCVVQGVKLDLAATATITEFVILALILILWRLDRWHGWRDKWLNYRLLAELLRQADVAALAGRSMPFETVNELGADLPARGWVPLVYKAVIRDAGIAPVTVTGDSLATLQTYVGQARLVDQIEYHVKTMRRSEHAASWMRVLGLGFFGLTIAAVLIKIILWSTGRETLDWTFWLSLTAGVAPALAYILFAIRAQAEFEIVGQRSRRMIVRLKRVLLRLNRTRGAAVTSDALGTAILSAAEIMRHDAADWASIFDVKETEAG